MEKLTVERAEAVVEELGFTLSHEGYDGGLNRGCIKTLMGRMLVEARGVPEDLGIQGPSESAKHYSAVCFAQCQPYMETQSGLPGAYLQGLEAGYEAWPVEPRSYTYREVYDDPNFIEGYRTGAEVDRVVCNDYAAFINFDYLNDCRAYSEKVFAAVETGSELPTPTSPIAPATAYDSPDTLFVGLTEGARTVADEIEAEYLERKAEVEAEYQRKLAEVEQVRKDALAAEGTDRPVERQLRSAIANAYILDTPLEDPIVPPAWREEFRQSLIEELEDARRLVEVGST